jgi:acetyl-CoA carboxylase carboxyltransferase component
MLLLLGVDLRGLSGTEADAITSKALKISFNWCWVKSQITTMGARSASRFAGN